MNFEDMTLPQLKAEAKARSMKGYSTLKKNDLIAAILDFDDNESDNEQEAFEQETIKDALASTDYLELLPAPKQKPIKVEGVESFIDGIKAAARNAADARSLKGVEAGRKGTVTAPLTPGQREGNYHMQNKAALSTFNLTAKQNKRFRKKANKVLGVDVRG